MCWDLEVKGPFFLSPAPLGESPFGEDLALAEAAGRLPMGARASLVYVVVRLSFPGVFEVSGRVLERGYRAVRVDDRQARRSGGRGLLAQGLGNPGRVVVGVEPFVDGDVLVAAPACYGLDNTARAGGRTLSGKSAVGRKVVSSRCRP